MEGNYYTYNILKKLYYNSQQYNDLNEEEEILQEYSKNENPKSLGIEVADKLVNINGTHSYPIISAKDIDWNHVFFPSSEIDSKNWGNFDSTRQWGDNLPIYVDNVYELMNIIDYLLCSCNDLWSEINRLKYGDTNPNEIWFTANYRNAIFLIKYYALDNSDFKKETIGINKGMSCTYLDPTRYYTTLAPTNFGFVTMWHLSDFDKASGLYLVQRTITKSSGRNSIKAYISELVDAELGDQTIQNIDGINQNIFGYKINGDLHLFPGFDIDTFTNRNYVTTNIISLIDFKNKKFKRDECYFKVNNNDYKKVYCEFLYSDPKIFTSDEINTSGDEGTYYPPFILYYKDDNKKYVIYISWPRPEQDGDEHVVTCNLTYGGSVNISRSDIISKLTVGKGNSYSQYEIHSEDLDIHGYPNNWSFSQDENGLNIPYIYVIPDEIVIQLNIKTPNIESTDPTIPSYKETIESIDIRYYKSDNNLNVKIFTNSDTSLIKPSSDFEEISKNCISYNPIRYNIPDDKRVNISAYAPYIYNEENPNQFKIDDEYIDIPLFDYTSHLSQYSQYYKYLYIDSETGKRVFSQFTSQEEFTQYCQNNILHDLGNDPFVFVYKKIQNPYTISYQVSFNSQVDQEANQSVIKNIVNEINSNPEYLHLSNGYNNLILNYNLSGLEQVKLDLELNIEETGKVKSSSYILPINITKVHNPTIHFTNLKEIKQEIQEYKQEALYNNPIYDEENNEYNNNYITLGSIYDKVTRYGDNYKELNDIVSYLWGDTIANGTVDYHFYDNTGNKFEISYNHSKPYINLIGSYYLESHKQAPNFNFVKVGSFILEHAYIFNIQGLGENYRLNSTNNLYTEKYNVSSGNRQNTNQILDYDILNNVSINDYSNLSYFLGFKFDDRNGAENNYQLGHYSYSSVASDNYFENDYSTFIYGIDPNGEDNISKINTDIFDIVLENPKIELDRYNLSSSSSVIGGTPKYNRINKENNKISYYINEVYLDIKTTTFFPPYSTFPTREVGEDDDKDYIYDFNETQDVQKFSNYRTSWDEIESNYHPVTLSLKYIENNYRNTPYINESNEAKMVFDIKRNTTEGGTVHYAGANPVGIALGEKYYLSYFINAHISLDTNTESITDRLSVGSYMYYNKTTHNYNIHEIYSNQVGSKERIPSFNDADLGVNASDIQGSEKVNAVFPILKDPETDKYIYDIERISRINKIDLSSNTSIDGISFDLSSLMTVNIEENIINYYRDHVSTHCEISSSGHISLKPIELGLRTSKVYGNQKYTGKTLSTIPNPSFVPLYRIKDERELITYPTLTLTIGSTTETLEFFVFKTNNIYSYPDCTPLFVIDENGAPDNNYTAFESQLISFRNLTENQGVCDSDHFPELETPMSSRASEIYIDE